MVTPEDKKKHTRRTILLAGISCAIGAVVNHRLRDKTLRDGYLLFDHLAFVEAELASIVDTYGIMRIGIVDLPRGELMPNTVIELESQYRHVTAPFKDAWNHYKSELEKKMKDKPILPPRDSWPLNLREYYRSQQPVKSTLERYASGEFTFNPLKAAHSALELNLHVHGTEIPVWQPFALDRWNFARDFQRALEQTNTIDLSVTKEYAMLKETLVLRMNTLAQAVERHNLLNVSEPLEFAERIPTWISSTQGIAPLMLCVYGSAIEEFTRHAKERSLTVRHECCETPARKV